MGRRASVSLLLLMTAELSTAAAAQAIDGSVTGIVRDASGAPMAGALVTVTNAATGLIRETTSGQDGRFQVPLVPPGTYSIRGRRDGFRMTEHAGLSLHSGQLLIVHLELSPGFVSEIVTVTAGARADQVEAGRTFSPLELSRLPRVLKNPLNDVLHVPGVTGNEADEQLQPRINANGAQARNHFQFDGNSNTQRDRAGLRLANLSPMMVGELRVSTAGFAPEFGQASGVHVNVVSPSGTNTWRGSATAAFTPAALVARSPLIPPGAPQLASRSVNVIGSLGGPLRRDRAFVFGGIHFIRRDSSNSPIAIASEDAAQLGLELPATRVVDEGQSEYFTFGKVDLHASAAHRISARLATFHNDSPLAGGSGLEAPERYLDVFVRTGSAAAQVTSVLGTRTVNELRAQVARRRLSRRPSAFSAPPPAVDVAGVAAFGGSFAANTGAGSDSVETVWQLIDSLSWQRRGHVIKTGVDVQSIHDRRVNTLRRQYSFTSIGAYLDARSGVNPRGYSRYLQDSGDPHIAYRTVFVAAFAQDDWQVARNLRATFGLRYDLFGTPATGEPAAFRTDRNNVAPRLGVSWAADERGRTTVRASVGLMFDPPPLALYENALMFGRDRRVRTLLLRPNSPGAPAFPDIASGVTQIQSIVEVAPDFETQSTWLTHVQFAHAFHDRASIGLAVSHASGRGLPVLVDTNLIPSGASLPDGRPIFSAVVSSATRREPAFDHIDLVTSRGRSAYRAVTASFALRPWDALTMDGSYTRASARDDAPLTNVYVQGSQDDRPSDPTDLSRDYGPTPFSHPHSFSLQATIASGDGTRTMPLLRRLTVNLAILANSGLPANLRSNVDLNGDGQMNDRPAGVSRNSARVGRYASIDARVERAFDVGQARTLTAGLSVRNLLDRANPAMVNRITQTDAMGQPRDTIPSSLPVANYFDGRRAEMFVVLRF